LLIQAQRHRLRSGTTSPYDADNTNVTIQQPPTVNMAAAPGPEITVAEGTRQARIAKAVREAKEKAESDNPAPPQW